MLHLNHIFDHFVKGAVGEHGLLVVESGQDDVKDEAFCLIYYPSKYFAKECVRLLGISTKTRLFFF